MPVDACWLIPVLLGLGWVACSWQRHHSAQPGSTASTTTIQRLLKPRTPQDCAACRQQATRPILPAPPGQVVRPWREVKSRRGAP